MSGPFIPPERESTPRESLLQLLSAQPKSARELSQEAGLSERDVVFHLGHLQKTLKTKRRRLRVTPATCLDCGYVFHKRTRLTSPGKCPVCRSTHLSDPLFSLK